MEKYTDQEFFYKQTPVNYDGIAKFTSIKGNTLGWNQQCNQFDSTYWARNNCTATWGTTTATVTATNSALYGLYLSASYRNTLTSHSYLFVCDVTLSNGGQVQLGFDNQSSQSVSANTKTHIAKIMSPSADKKAIIFYKLASGVVAGETMKIDNAMLFDLTQMGLDISSPSEFPFSLPYYDYNQGTLIPFSGNGIKTVGFNQWDEEWEVGSINSSGNNYSSASAIRAKNYIPIIPNTVYCVNGNGSVMKVRFYDGNENFISAPPWNASNPFNVFTSPTNACYIRFATADGYGATYKNDICINISSSRNGEYEPYTETTTDLPISTYFPTGMKRAGSVYDELTESKAITRVGSRAYQSGDEDNANYVTDGTTTYYPLATETETDAEDIFYKFYGNGTEQLLPVNGSSPTTSYLIADIEYYDSTEGDSLYRRFWLINGDGERWDLTDKEFKSFLNNPTGLGFRKTIEVTRYGEKANKNNEVYDFPQPSGELLFYDTYNSTRYNKYNKFIRFLMSQPITLYYMIPVSYISGIANIFTLDCDVTEVQKTESKTDHILTSSIVFNGLGFYEGDEISVNGTTNTYTLTNEGDFPVGFEITVEGSLTNPYITLSQDGELYGEAKFDSATAFNSLYLNSNDGEQNIILQQGGSVIPNPLSYQDLSISNGSIYVTFVKLARGISELEIGMESGSITSVEIKYQPIYRSV